MTFILTASKAGTDTTGSLVQEPGGSGSPVVVVVVEGVEEEVVVVDTMICGQLEVCVRRPATDRSLHGSNVEVTSGRGFKITDPTPFVFFCPGLFEVIFTRTFFSETLTLRVQRPPLAAIFTSISN